MPGAKLNKQSFILVIRGGSVQERGTDTWLLASQSNNTEKLLPSVTWNAAFQHLSKIHFKINWWHIFNFLIKGLNFTEAFILAVSNDKLHFF